MFKLFFNFFFKCHFMWKCANKDIIIVWRSYYKDTVLLNLYRACPRLPSPNVLQRYLLAKCPLLRASLFHTPHFIIHLVITQLKSSYLFKDSFVNDCTILANIVSVGELLCLQLWTGYHISKMWHLYCFLT